MSPFSTPSVPCLSDLEIADLMTGRLQGDSRERALRHLVDCEDCHDLFVEAQALLAESSEEPAGSPRETKLVEASASSASGPLSFGPRPATPRWFPWALAAVLLAGIGLAWLIPGPSRLPSSVGSWSALGELPVLVLAPGSLTPLPTRNDNRGTGSGDSQTAGDFRLGAEWAHLETAWRAGATEEARATVQRLQELVRSRVDSGDLTEDLARDLDTLLEAVAESDDHLANPSPATLTTRLSAEMAILGYEFDLGRFAEAGRLAAEAGYGEWFEPGGEAARYLREMRATAAERQASADQLAPEAKKGLEAVASAWPSGAAEGEERFRNTARAFEDLILAYDG